MVVSRFEYFAPDSVEEVCRLLAEKGNDVYLLAGGTDLMVKIKHRLLSPKTVIGLKQIQGIDQIIFDALEIRFVPVADCHGLMAAAGKPRMPPAPDRSLPRWKRHTPPERTEPGNDPRSLPWSVR